MTLDKALAMFTGQLIARGVSLDVLVASAKAGSVELDDVDLAALYTELFLAKVMFDGSNRTKH